MRPSSATNGLKQALQFGLDNKLHLADAQQEIALETRCIGWITRSSRAGLRSERPRSGC